MSPPEVENHPSTPNIEASPSPAPEQNGPGLDLRLRQQEILAELGVLSLQGQSLQALLDAAVRMAAEGLRAQLSKVFEYIPAENRFLMRADVGWDPGMVGVATVGADLESPSGYALRTGKPVISNHLENEERFRTPDLLRVHGVRRAINVILQGPTLIQALQAASGRVTAVARVHERLYRDADIRIVDLSTYLRMSATT